MDIGIPHELWDKPSAEITQVKIYIYIVSGVSTILGLIPYCKLYCKLYCKVILTQVLIYILYIYRVSKIRDLFSTKSKFP